LELFLAFEIVVWLTTGAMIVLWLSELITDYGLGNGASLLNLYKYYFKFTKS
jgi:preprotein translocase subunit SecY